MSESVECFDPVTGAWAALPPMNTPRYCHAMVSFNGKLYVAGGLDTHTHITKSVECFDPATRVWTTLAPLNEKRVNVGLAVLGDKLYALGGGFGSVECLDLSLSDSQWTPVAPRLTAQLSMHFSGAIGTAGKIYATGAFSTATMIYLEYLDPKEGPRGQWTMSYEPVEGFTKDSKFTAI